MEPDGKLKLPPENIQESADQEKTEKNRVGVGIKRVGGREGDMFENTMLFDGFTNYGIAMTERTYLPKKLHAKFLTHEATERSEEEENRLREKHTKELNDVAEPKQYTEQELLEIAQMKFNFEEDRKESDEKEAQAASMKAAAESAKKKSPTKTEPAKKKQNVTSTIVKPEQSVTSQTQTQPVTPKKVEPATAKPTTQAKTMQPQNVASTTVNPTAQAKPTTQKKAATVVTTHKSATAPVTSAPAQKPAPATVSQPSKPKVVPITTRQTTAPVTPATTSKPSPNSYGMQEDFRSIGARYKSAFTKIQGLKTDLSDMKEVTGALESQANVTGKESPRQFMDMTHKLNVAMVN
jgi:hypothetical protein